MNKIVLGIPYDGALLWHLSPSEYNHNKGGKPYSGTHPYYQRLYGPQHFKIAPKAASLCVLYDEVIVAPADAALPEHRKYNTDAGYFNPHLGLRTSWDDFNSAQGWLKEQVQKDLEIPAVVSCLPEDPLVREFILQRTNLQILLALKNDAKILAGRSFFQLLNAKFAHLRNSEKFQHERTELPAKEQIIDNYFDVSCLQFKEMNYERMMTLKGDKQIRTYAKSFHGVLDKAVHEENPSEYFFRKLKGAMERREILEQVERGFGLGGAAITPAALHPLLAPIVRSLKGVLNFAKFGVSTQRKKDSWVLLGSRMSEVMMRDWTKKNTP